jgi:hypothetical protein
LFAFLFPGGGRRSRTEVSGNEDARVAALDRDRDKAKFFSPSSLFFAISGAFSFWKEMKRNMQLGSRNFTAE